MTYLIHESNIERLEKQLKTIQNKCNKIGTEFHYTKGNEVFQAVTDVDTLQTHVARFIEVEASGVARINGWEFVAVIEHMDGKGRNIVRQFNMNYTIPDRYYTVVPTCEHCNTKRTRKQTYLLVNESGKWKQVGGSCLKEFTGGLDAEQLAAYISCFDKLIEGESFDGSVSRQPKYFDTKMILQCTVEFVRVFGYVGTNDTEATFARVAELYDYLMGYPTNAKTKDRLDAMIEKHHMNPSSVDVDPIIDWVVHKADCSFGYMMNLRAVVDTEYVKGKHLGLLCSAVPTYNREMERIAKESARKAQMAAEAAGSSYVGTKGEKITVKVTSCKCVTSWDTQYGTTFMYKFVDDQNRVLIWMTSNYVDCDHVVELTGKVKGHEEYNGVKQTIVYFCKVKIEQPKDPGPSAEDLAQARVAADELDAAFRMLDDYYEDATDHEYGPSTPWNAPGMKVSDFIRVSN